MFDAKNKIIKMLVRQVDELIKSDARIDHITSSLANIQKDKREWLQKEFR